jgi:hypothetical protein
MRSSDARSLWSATPSRYKDGEAVERDVDVLAMMQSTEREKSATEYFARSSTPHTSRASRLDLRQRTSQVLVRHGLVSAIARKRRREDYRRWERPKPMQLWQLDIMGSVMITDPTAAGGRGGSEADLRDR